MSKKTAVLAIFVVAALYDGILGLAFLFGAEFLFERFGVTPPNHYGYIHCPAALMLVFALMFAAVAWMPYRNRNLIPYGILLKVSYSGVALYHWLTAGIPTLWKPLALIDLLFIPFLLVCYVVLGRTEPEESASPP